MWHELVDIENNLGIYANLNIPERIQSDAGKLADAMKINDKETARKILNKYQNELTKGDVQGGPKEVKTGNAIKKRIARTALLFINDVC